MTSQEILTAVRVVLARKPFRGNAELVGKRRGQVIIELSQPAVLNVLLEIAEITGDDFVLVCPAPEGGGGLSLFINCTDA